MAFYMYSVSVAQKINRKCFPCRPTSIGRFFSAKPVKKLPKEVALEHFDDFYGPIFGRKWPSIRLGLLCPHKYCAVMNPFSKVDKMLQNLNALGVKNLRQIYKRRQSKLLGLETSDSENLISDDLEDGYESIDRVEEETTGDSRTSIDAFIPTSEMRYQEEIITDSEYHHFYHANDNFPVNFQEESVPFPEKWNILILPRGDINRFPFPPRDSTDLFGYYLLDAASLLPVWALNLTPREHVGDFCAAPGGKSLAALFTFCPKSLFCNDMSGSRMNRLKIVFSSYVPNVHNIQVAMSQKDSRMIEAPDGFDKILLDVPCTNDRMSTSKDENSIFKASRMKERVTMPQLQSELLLSALKCLKPKGSLVYSTCSLSPIQNDGVVHVTLKKLWQETAMEFVVRDIKDSFQPLNGIFRFDYSCKYGILVLPYLPSNYGPMYFSKITRNK